MNINDIQIGDHVLIEGGFDEGVVVDINYAEHLVFVETRVPGRPPQTDVVDVDPDDLDPAP